MLSKDNCNVVVEVLTVVGNSFQISHSVDSHTVPTPGAVSALMHIVELITSIYSIGMQLPSPIFPKQHFRAQYQALGIAIDQACSRLDSRHYPFGPATAHFLGDLRTGESFHAPNASL